MNSQNELRYQWLHAGHREVLESRGISGEIAIERGYQSMESKADLARRGFTAGQQNSGLLIPLHDAWGRPGGYLLRPDEPRFKDGKALKYEMPGGSRMILDVPPRSREGLRDPSVPLFITEGPLKADALLSAGAECVVALQGVWGFRGTNDEGGKALLADFEAVAFNGREIYIAFDSDSMTNPNVHLALERLVEVLRRRDASVQVVELPPGEQGQKVGVDDFLAQGHTLDDVIALASPSLRSLPDVADEPADPPDTFVDLPDESGAELLEDVLEFFKRYVTFPSVAAAEAVTLWAAHTHAIDAFDSTPRLDLSSPEKGAGKTRILEALELTAARPRQLSSMSVAYLFRSIAKSCPTILLDEVDAIFGRRTGDTNEDLRAVINAGHRRGATVGRMVGEGASMQPREFPVFAPIALAGIGRVPDTIAHRSIGIFMRRRSPEEHVEPFRRRDAEAQATPLQRRLGAWTTRRLEALRQARPEMPPGITDRAADKWEPLLAIADTAGGDWPERARAAALALEARTIDNDTSVGMRLLDALRTIFVDAERDRLETGTLMTKLNDDEAAPWASWNHHNGIDGRDLANRLKPYGIRPTKWKQQGSSRRGYVQADFADTWNRYLPPLPSPSAQPDPATPATLATESTDDQLRLDTNDDGSGT